MRDVEGSEKPPVIDAVDRSIIDALQGGFPVCDRPYAAAAAQLGISEEVLLARLQSLLDRKVLTRFGPMFQIERMGGA
jgi:DNA-binding Lrp family transcriptional regulator